MMPAPETVAACQGERKVVVVAMLKTEVARDRTIMAVSKVGRDQEIVKVSGDGDDCRLDPSQNTEETREGVRRGDEGYGGRA
jgi:hypothetical protein